MDARGDSSLWALKDEQVRAIRKQAGIFTFNLVKALLQTGYYSADHPLAKAAAADIYSQFREVTKKTYDMSYVLVSTVDQRGVMIDGLTPEPIEVARVFRGIMGDHFVGKFHDYFVRNRMAFFTIKRNITEEEFERFMGIWVAWAAMTATRKESVTQLMSDQLNHEGLLSVTVVGIDEIPGARRHLPWSVKVALGRLRKDLSRLPLLKDATAEAITQLKGQVIEDIMRPVTKPDLIRDLLIHADLVCEGMEDVAVEDVEDSMIGTLQARLIHHVSTRLLKFVQFLSGEVKESEVHVPDLEQFRISSKRVSRKVLVKLAQGNFQEAQPTLLAAYETGIVTLEELPDALQDRVKASELVEVFKKSPKNYLNDFQTCTDRGRYLKFVEVFEIIVPELIQLKEVGALSAFLSILQRHLMEKTPAFTDRAVHAGEIVNMLVNSGSVDGLVNLAAHTPKEKRAVLESAMFLFGAKPIPTLVRVLIKSKDASVRRAAIDMLTQVGENSAPALVDELRAHRHPWFVARNFIDILGKVGAREGVEAITQYVDNAKVQVRESCLLALSAILGNDASEHLLPFLEDEEPMLVRRAIHTLGSARYTGLPYLQKLYDEIAPRRREAEDTSTAIQTASMVALTHFAHGDLPKEPDLEGALLSIVSPSLLRRHLPTLLGTPSDSSDLKVMAVRALGAMGTERCLGPLDKLAAKGAEDLRQTAAEAALAIRERPPPPVE